MSDAPDNLALVFKATTKVELVKANDGSVVMKDGRPVETIIPTETVFVRLKAHPDIRLRVTGVDEERGRWVCCAAQVEGGWHHERYRPDELEVVERVSREA